MSLLTATNLAKSFGAQDVLAGISLAIPSQARIALVGPNGIGKTTLLCILAGLEHPDKGRVHGARGLRVEYLPQDMGYARYGREELQLSLWEYALNAFAELREREAELARLEADMAKPELAEAAMERYGPRQQAFEQDGGYVYPTAIRRVLSGIGFTPAHYQRTLTELSGGERTRALLARLLLDNPDLLLLDEPTNQLDLQAVEWLETWLRDWPGAAVIVSHDRYFLDSTVNLVWDLSLKGLESYRGNYSAYVQQRWERRQLRGKRYRKQQEHIRKEQEYIQRNIAGQSSRQAKGRRKRLARLIRDEAIAPLSKDRQVRFDFGKVERAGDLVIETRGLVVPHPETREALVLVADLRLNRGEFAAVIGPNGAGKTTFLKTLQGMETPLEGSVRLGANVQLGYLAQAQEGLERRHTVLQELMGAAPDLSEGKARHWLGRFLFTGEDVEKRVEMLSGGERARLAVAKLTLMGANLLLLDEPTTHLDLPSQEVLQQALAQYPGTVLLVSHDRYLIDALATQIWDISDQSRQLRVHKGGYAEYAAIRQQEAEERKAEVQSSRIKAPSAKPGGKPSKRTLKAIEASIASLEAEIKDLASQLERVGSNVDEVRRLGSRYAQVEAELNDQLAAWERLERGDGAA
jgi:ATP-binding cassette subfamily F protein 3